ncbi:hypothetical protein TK1346 [Thermococcus kodakarensis KOD1]|uniref:Uncharacterized protein n=2 Tax=Thermococcus TaxID=2263 RepID=Q5JGU2_THEKO|nr:hypothetical protein TK1346 [Thermococcus kodakarensis KOD1]
MTLLMKGTGGSRVLKHNLVSITPSGNIESGIMFIENASGGTTSGAILYLLVIGEGGDYVSA